MLKIAKISRCNIISKISKYTIGSLRQTKSLTSNHVKFFSTSSQHPKQHSKQHSKTNERKFSSNYSRRRLLIITCGVLCVLYVLEKFYDNFFDIYLWNEYRVESFLRKDYAARMLYHGILSSIDFERLAIQNGFDPSLITSLSGFAGTHLTFVLKIIKTILREKNLHEDYRQFLLQFKKDVERSIPYSYQQYVTKMKKYEETISQVREKLLKESIERLKKDLQKMKVNDKIILPFGQISQQHRFFLVITKSKIPGMVDLQFFDTGVNPFLNPNYSKGDKKCHTDCKFVNIDEQKIIKHFEEILRIGISGVDNGIILYCEKVFGKGQIGKLHKPQRGGTCTWEPFDKMVAEWTDPVNKWRFKVDYRSYILNEYKEMMPKLQMDEAPETQRFYKFMLDIANEIIEKNKIKLQSLENR